MQYINSFCLALYKGFLQFGEVMTRRSSWIIMLLIAGCLAFLFLSPKGLTEFTLAIIAGWFIGSKLADLHTYLKKRVD